MAKRLAPDTRRSASTVVGVVKMDANFDFVELGFVVSLEVLREVLSTLSVEGKKWWVASDPEDAAERGTLTVGHGDPSCKDRLNTIHLQIPIISAMTPRYYRPRLVLLFDRSYVQPESPGFCLEHGVVIQDSDEDFQSFFYPIVNGLAARLQAKN
jgi:hypothetical protein